MKILKQYIFLFCIGIVSITKLNGQENISMKCMKLLNNGYVSDGQEYKAILDENNKAKFYSTFYGGSKYRIITCSNVKKHPLIFSVFDTEKNLLFCNKSHDYSPYWNFTFTSTIECIIEIEFEAERHIKDEVMLLIGFKQK